MTDPIVRLESVQLSAEPGGQARTTVTVRNLGTIVEGFRLEVLGEGVTDWAEISPPEVQVLPAAETTAVVVFSPPAAGVPSGTFPFGVRAESVVNPETSAVAEGDLAIGRVFGLQSKLTPMNSTGRWRGKHLIELTNSGNSPMHLRLVAGDPDDRLAFLMGPEAVDLPQGVTAHAALMVKTRKPFLRGSPVRLPFHVTAEPHPLEVPAAPPPILPNPHRVVLDGAFTQRPILSKVVVTAAVVAVLALGAGLAWALTRDKDVVSGELTAGAPRTPGLMAVSADAGSVQLLWKGQPDVQSYKIHQLTADRKTSGVVPIDGALETYAVRELSADTEYCFQLEAIRDNQSSPLSEVQCARTSGAAAPPTGTVPFGTEPSDPSTSASAAGSSGETTAIGEGTPTVLPGQGGAGGSADSVTESPTPSSGATSAGAGTSGPSASVSSSPVSGEAFTANQYIVVVFTYQADDLNPLQRSQDKQQEFNNAGIPAKILHTTDFPELQGPTRAPLKDSYLLYVGPFDNQQSAQTKCDNWAARNTSCFLVRPRPNG